jgi:hypothetical protein
MKRVSTPWGQADSVTVVAPGIAFLSTPRHGGYRVSKALAENEIPKVQLDRAAIFQSGYYWFEEDCAWSIVGLNFPQYFPAEAHDAAIRSINRWFPTLVGGAQ